MGRKTRGKSQTCVKRAFALVDEAIGLKPLSWIILDKISIRYAFTVHGVEVPLTQSITVKNMLGSICEEVVRISNGWIQALPTKDGEVFLYNGFTHDGRQSRPGVDKADWNPPGTSSNASTRAQNARAILKRIQG